MVALTCSNMSQFHHSEERNQWPDGFVYIFDTIE